MQHSCHSELLPRIWDFGQRVDARPQHPVPGRSLAAMQRALRQTAPNSELSGEHPVLAMRHSCYQPVGLFVTTHHQQNVRRAHPALWRSSHFVEFSEMAISSTIVELTSISAAAKRARRAGAGGPQAVSSLGSTISCTTSLMDAAAGVEHRNDDRGNRTDRGPHKRNQGSNRYPER